AQSERADHAVEVTCREGQALTRQTMLVDDASAFFNTPLCQPVHARIGIHRRERPDAVGVMRQVQSAAEPDLQDIAVGVFEQSAAVLGHPRAVERKLTLTWKHDASVPAHGFLRDRPIVAAAGAFLYG